MKVPVLVACTICHVADAFIQVPYSSMKELICVWYGWVQERRNPKTGYSYLCAVLTVVTPQPDYTSSEHFAICFPLEMVWHFVVVRQGHYMNVAPVWVDGAAVREPARWSDWKSMFGISRLSSSVWCFGRGVCLGLHCSLSLPRWVMK